MPQSVEALRPEDSSRVEFTQGAGPIALFLLLSAVVPILILSSSPELKWIVVLDWAMLAYSAFQLARLLRGSRPAWMKTVLHSYSYVWLGLAAFVQETVNDNPYHRPVEDRDAITAALIVLSGLIAYDAGVTRFGVRGFREPTTGVVHVGFRVELATVAPMIAGGTAAAAGLVYT